MRHRALLVSAALWFLVITGVTADETPSVPAKPGPEDRCAVCGMFVAKYPNWVASISFDDGTQVFFDGPKDMFKFLHNLQRYHRTSEQISELWVTDYYTTRPIKAREAFFVSGSDVMGPMGGELVPVGDEQAARGFAADHGGEAVLRFADIGPDQIPR